ncbi:MAG TPA: TerC family protein [Chitinophagales bacterium]|nr:TerC family protein [Chitinophagales bacterium]HRK27866.1 TerC family protein [Chitinophagales bacterium]
MDFLLQPEVWLSLLTLTLMEVVLGIDNLVFLSIISGRLPAHQQPKARRLGLFLALGFRILLLLGITWIIGLTEPVLSINQFGLAFDLSWRDIILAVGGLFLLYKATTEIHHKLEGADYSEEVKTVSSFGSVVLQIVLLDMVFSFDSILTAVGLVKHVEIMIIAVVISMVVMLVFVNSISAFIDKHPTVKMLALAFLLLIGFMLLAEGFHQHVPKGYIYFAMFFSLGVELLNMRFRTKGKTVKLHE